jgi:hypothetical protein
LSCCLCLWSWSSLQLILLPSKLDNWKHNSIRLFSNLCSIVSYLMVHTNPITKQDLCTSCMSFFEIASKYVHNQTLKKTSFLFFAHLWTIVHICMFTSSLTTKHLMHIRVDNFFSYLSTLTPMAKHKSHPHM